MTTSLGMEELRQISGLEESMQFMRPARDIWRLKHTKSYSYYLRYIMNLFSCSTVETFGSMGMEELDEIITNLGEFFLPVDRMTFMERQHMNLELLNPGYRFQEPRHLIPLYHVLYLTVDMVRYSLFSFFTNRAADVLSQVAPHHTALHDRLGIRKIQAYTATLYACLGALETSLRANNLLLSQMMVTMENATDLMPSETIPHDWDTGGGPYAGLSATEAEQAEEPMDPRFLASGGGAYSAGVQQITLRDTTGLSHFLHTLRRLIRRQNIRFDRHNRVLSLKFLPGAEGPKPISVYEPVYNPSLDRKQEMTAEDWIRAQVNIMPEFQCVLDRYPIQMLVDKVVPDFLEYKTRTKMAFRNGVYCLETRSFYPLGRTRMSRFSCCNFIDRPFGADMARMNKTEKILQAVVQDTPNLYLVLSTQGYDMAHPRDLFFALALLGRLMFDNGTDSWELLIFFKGIPGSGKSTISNLLEAMYRPDDVGVLGSTTQATFGWSDIVDKLITILKEVGAGSKLDDGTLLSAISAETGTFPEKFKSAKMGKTYTSMCMTSNVDPPFLRRNVEAFNRRLMIFAMDTPVLEQVNNLREKLLEERPAILAIIVNAYQLMLRAVGTRSIWRFLPPKFRRAKETFRKNDMMCRFLLERCTVEEGESMAVNSLMTALNAFAQQQQTDHNRSSMTWIPDVMIPMLTTMHRGSIFVKVVDTTIHNLRIHDEGDGDGPPLGEYGERLDNVAMGVEGLADPIDLIDYGEEEEEHARGSGEAQGMEVEDRSPSPVPQDPPAPVVDMEVDPPLLPWQCGAVPSQPRWYYPPAREEDEEDRLPVERVEEAPQRTTHASSSSSSSFAPPPGWRTSTANSLLSGNSSSFETGAGDGRLEDGQSLFSSVSSGLQ